MAKPNTAAYKTFDDITGRLDEIVQQVRDKDVSPEHSLDLFDEAIALGSKAVDMVDTTDFTPEEEAKFQEGAQDASAEKSEDASADAPQGAEGASDAPEASDEAKGESEGEQA